MKKTKEKQFYIYLHCKPDGTPFYVGKGHGRRCMEFTGRNNHHKNIIEKYGKEKIIIIKINKDSEESALRSEIRMIKILRNAGFELANKSSGGESPNSGGKHTEEFKQKMSLRNLGRKHSKETCEKISQRLRGKKKTVAHRAKLSIIASNRSQETRAKISKANKGRAISEEWRLNLSKARKGKKFTDEHCANLSASLKGIKNFLGKKHTVETRAKMSAARKLFNERKKDLSLLNVYLD